MGQTTELLCELSADGRWIRHDGRDMLMDTGVHELVRIFPVLHEGAIVLDVGAGAGHFAHQVFAEYPSAAVYSFEPTAQLFMQLRSAAESNKHHTALRLALGSENRMRTIRMTKAPKSNSFLRFLPDGPLAEVLEEVGSENVIMRRLDDWYEETIGDWDRIAFLKMDAQGYELEIIRGADKVLANTTAVLAEVSFVPQYQDHPLVDDVDRELGDRGFSRAVLLCSPRPDLWADGLYVRKELLESQT